MEINKVLLASGLAGIWRYVEDLLADRGDHLRNVDIGTLGPAFHHNKQTVARRQLLANVTNKYTNI